MKYRPSKRFLLTLLPLSVLVISAGFALLPRLDEFEARPIPGEITFRKTRPSPDRPPILSSLSFISFRTPMEWFEEKCENLLSWDFNPWKRPISHFGDHLEKLKASTNPLDQAKLREIQRLADAWHQRLLLRFPELAVPLRNVPDEQNAVVKWAKFSEKYKVGADYKSIEFPQVIAAYLKEPSSWNTEAAQAWLAEQKPLLDELRSIGLTPDRSINGISFEHFGFNSARLAKSCAEALFVEARLAAEMGDAVTALESTRAAKGFADLWTDVETPTLLAATVHILLQLDLERRVLNEILPALSSENVDPAAWEAVLKPIVHPPAEFARIMKGEWSVTSRQFLLPMLLDSEDPKSPPDSGDLLDFYSQLFLSVVRAHETAALTDLPKLQIPPSPDDSHLSHASQGLTCDLSTGSRAWRKGWDRAQSISAMTQAAFAIMKGQPIPQDPIYRVDYLWNPTTRQLSLPTGKPFDELEIKPITVPKW